MGASFKFGKPRPNPNPVDKNGDALGWVVDGTIEVDGVSYSATFPISDPDDLGQRTIHITGPPAPVKAPPNPYTFSVECTVVKDIDVRSANTEDKPE